MEMTMNQSQPLTTVVVGHRNKMLMQIGKLQAERHGLRVFTTSHGDDVVTLARQHRPELIVLGNDLQKPTTEETLKLLQADPELRGIRVVTLSGSLPSIKDLLGKSVV